MLKVRWTAARNGVLNAKGSLKDVFLAAPGPAGAGFTGWIGCNRPGRYIREFYKRCSN